MKHFLSICSRFIACGLVACGLVAISLVAVAHADVVGLSTDGNGDAPWQLVDSDTSAGTDRVIDTVLADVPSRSLSDDEDSEAPTRSMIPALAVMAIMVILRVKLRHHWQTTRTPSAAPTRNS